MEKPRTPDPTLKLLQMSEQQRPYEAACPAPECGFKIKGTAFEVNAAFCEHVAVTGHR